jgi:hypothetical protein
MRLRADARREARYPPTDSDHGWPSPIRAATSRPAAVTAEKRPCVMRSALPSFSTAARPTISAGSWLSRMGTSVGGSDIVARSIAMSPDQPWFGTTPPE